MSVFLKLDDDVHSFVQDLVAGFAAHRAPELHERATRQLKEPQPEPAPERTAKDQPTIPPQEA